MTNVVAANALGATIHARRSDPSWGTETWPVRLGYGVTLAIQPGLSFYGLGAGQTLFDVSPSGVAAADSLQVTITSEDPSNSSVVSIGTNAANPIQVCNVAIQASDVALQISGVSLSGSSAALLASGSSQTITLGPAPVVISSPGVGIDLQGGSMVDTGTSTDPVLTITGGNNDFLAESGQAMFNRPIVLGPSPDDAGSCPTPKADYIGLNFSRGSAVVMLLGGATIQCTIQDGISSNDGSGTVLLGNDGGVATGAPTTITHAGCSGVFVRTGHVYASNTTVTRNHYGFAVRNDGGAALGTGAILPDGTACVFCTGNAVGCSSSAEPGGCNQANWPGIDIWNNSVYELHAEGIQLLEVGAADYVCATGGNDNEAMSSCSCSGSACVSLQPSDSPPDGAPTVTSLDSSVSATASLINTTGFTLGPTCN